MKTTTKDLTKGTIWKQLIAFAIPLIWGNLFQLTYNMVDSIVVGQFAGQDALAAVGTSDPIMNLHNYENYKNPSDEQEGIVMRYYNENNELGVLYSPGYGVGWSSMGDKELAYDKRIVEYWLTEHPDIQKMEMYLERIGYHGVWMGGYNNLKIAWIPKGTMFYIHEYDDSESIETPKSCGMMMT